MSRMLRLIDGVLYEGRPADEYEAAIHRLGNDHVEVTAKRNTWWTEMRPATADELEVWAKDREDPARIEERREANRGRAARRATTNVRRRVKVAGLDAMLTLTYRVLQQDLALCKKHLKEFVRRMRRLIPGWQYVAAFEKQTRGCWHVHMAIHKLPMNLPASNGVKVKSYNIVRAVWRSVVGHDNGNIDQSRRKASSGRSPSKLAAYISKYMLKAFRDGDDWSNRYSCSEGLGTLPAPQRMRGPDLGDLIVRVYRELVDDLAKPGLESWLTGRKAWRDGAYDGPLESFYMSSGPAGPQGRFDG